MSSIALDQPNVVRGLQFIAGRVLPLVVWVTIFCGAFAFIEPSPYEFSFLLLLGIALLRGMAVPAVVLVPFALLVLFNLGGIISLAATEPEYDAQKFIAVSGYLSVTVIVIALVIAENPERMRVVKNAYIAAALVTAVAAIIGYFDIAGTGGVFTENSRARGMFKDPNVMAPFLILPAVLLLHDILRARARPHAFLRRDPCADPDRDPARVLARGMGPHLRFVLHVRLAAVRDQPDTARAYPASCSPPWPPLSRRRCW